MKARLFLTLAVAVAIALLLGSAAAQPMVIGTVPVRDGPHGVAANPSTSLLYVANEGSDNVSVINGITSEVVGDPIPVGDQPQGVALNPNTNRIYVVNGNGNSVSVIDGDTNTVVGDPIPVGNTPLGVAVNASTNLIYVSNFNGNSVSVIDGDTNTVVGNPIPVAGYPFGVAANPSTNFIYVANHWSESLSVIDGNPLSPEYHSEVDVVPLAGEGLGVAVNPITNRIYVVTNFDDDVSVIDGDTNTVVGDPILVQDEPYGVATNPTAHRIYVANHASNTVSVIWDPYPSPGSDSDGDGCTWCEETFGAPSPRPGSTCASPDPCYSDSNWYDFYDVPVPAMPDPTPNGPKDQAVAMDDVLAVLFYVGSYDGDGGKTNANGVAYDSVKGSCDWNGDTVPDKEGLCYDRSSGPEPNPPYDAGPPDGAVTMADVLVVLAQVGLSCIEPP